MDYPYPPTSQDVWPKTIERAKAGDRKAFGQLTALLQDYLTRIANRKIEGGLRAKFDASDVFQQSSLDAYAAIEQFSGSSLVEFRAWMTKILYSRIVDQARYYRSKRRDIGLEVSVDQVETKFAFNSPNFQLDSTNVIDTKNLLNEALKSLPARQRYVVEARHRLGMTYRQIASETDCSEAAVRKLWSRAIGRIKKQVSIKHEYQQS